jgi:hypothetical protein
MTAAAAPKWMLLEPYVFRRDDDKSFPDDTVAPFRASGTTTWGAKVSIAFSLAEAPPPPDLPPLRAAAGLSGSPPDESLARAGGPPPSCPDRSNH